MNDSAIVSDWEVVRKELFTSEEIAASNLRVAIIGEMIKELIPLKIRNKNY